MLSTPGGGLLLIGREHLVVVQVCGEEPQGDVEAGRRRQGVGLLQGV